MNKPVVVAVALFALAGGEAWAVEPPALDDGLYATFTMDQTGVSFTVCGSTGGSSGCYGSSTLYPFDYACGVLQGKPKTKGDTMTRDIYVLDKRTSSTDDMMLYVYERKDVIANGYDTVSAALKKTVDLGITGGSKAHCMLAGNLKYVYAATDKSSGMAVVSRSGNSVSGLRGTPVSITADDRGYIALNFSGTSAVVDPDGNTQQSGGGNYWMINQRNGWIQN